MQLYGGVDVKIHIFLISTLVVGERSASRPCSLPVKGNSPQYQLDMRLDGPQSWSGQYEEVKIVDPTGTPQSPSP
jgi:hypothetical protein